MYTVYILYSIKYNKIYIGYTSDIENRIFSHNETGKGWTKNFLPWQLIYKEEFEKKKDATIREKQLKTAKGRDWIWNEVISKL